MGYSTKNQRPQRKGASNRAALEESKFFRKVNNELTEIIESRIRENERLRAECDEWHRVAMCKQDIIDHMRDARDENEKLRNLVVKAHTCERYCADCYQEEGCCPIEREMQELGIEDKDE